MSFSLDRIAIKRIQNYSNRPTVIFLHDSLGCIELWRDFPDKLCELISCNALIYDRPGYGKSCNFLNPKRSYNYLEQEADLLLSLLDFWKLDQVFLFGHSDGGSIALIAASKYPNRIQGVVTEGAHVFVEDITIQGILDAVQLYQTTDLPQRLKKYHGDKTEAMFNAWYQTWTEPGFKSWNMEPFLQFITCPTLAIQGVNDEFGSEEQVDRIVNQVKGPGLKFMVEMAKHTPHKENPIPVLEKVSQIMIHWM